MLNGSGKKTLHTSLLIGVPVSVFAAALALLSLLHAPYATWLQVEVPAYAVAGGALDVRIRLGRVPEPSFLVVDLYLLEKDYRAINGHPALTPPFSAESGGTYSFNIEVTEAEKLALLRLVIYLSPTGEWRTRTHAASSETIPVKIHGSKAGSPALRKIQAFGIGSTGNPPESSFAYRSVALRMFLLGLLAIGGLACMVPWMRPGPIASPHGTRERLFWQSASILLFLGLLWEIFHLEERLSGWGRGVLSRLDLYSFRQSYQEAVLALLAAGIAAVLVMSARAVSRNRARLCPVLAGIALVCYTSLSLAAALSFHFIDSLKRFSLAGASLVDLAKAACAAAVLALALAAPGRTMDRHVSSHRER